MQQVIEAMVGFLFNDSDPTPEPKNSLCVVALPTIRL
jgi:hypothetical protein